MASPANLVLDQRPTFVEVSLARDQRIGDSAGQWICELQTTEIGFEEVFSPETFPRDSIASDVWLCLMIACPSTSSNPQALFKRQGTLTEPDLRSCARRMVPGSAVGERFWWQRGERR